MSIPNRKPGGIPESYTPKKPEIVNMLKDKIKNTEENEVFAYKNNVELVTLNEEIKVVGLSYNECKRTGLLTLKSPFDLYGRDSFEIQSRIKNVKYPQIGYAVGIMGNADQDLIVGKEVTDCDGQDEIYGSYIIPAGRYLKVSFNAKNFEELVQEILPKSGELFNVDAFLKSHNLIKDHVLYIEVYPHETCCVGQDNGPGWGPKYMAASMTAPATPYPEMYTLHTVKEKE